jgi:tetratricopeptide (TPR) repeat protein
MTRAVISPADVPIGGLSEKSDATSVRSYLSANGEVEHTPSSGEVTDVTAGSGQSSSGAEHIRQGQLVGRYMVIEHLGSGGAGDVFAAWDPELDRRIALKLLRARAHPTGAGKEAQQRMVREARAMARLSHPNVATVHEVGLAEGMVFIAMEYVPGLTLKEWGQRSDDWKRARELLLQAGEGLVAAHEAGLVHRDFKPANVLVGEDGRPRVLDFGLARSRSDWDDNSGGLRLSSGSGDNHTPSDELTRADVVLGTPAYMAPEQFFSKAIDARADQFSFCVTAFEVFYGHRPFQAKGDALVDEILSGQVAPPADSRGVPAWLHNVLLRGLSVRPDLRFSSMRELLEAMQGDRWSKRRWAATVAGSVVLLGIGGVLVHGLLQAPAAGDSQVDMLVEQADAAAARGRYVYPAVEEPDAPTAYASVLELEGLVGDVEEIADDKAQELRSDYATTLVRLGDRYWNEDGGAAFAADYYAEALVFDPDNEHALERVVLTPGELATLRSKAASSSFSDAELEAAEVLVAFSEADETQREQKVIKALKRRKKGGTLTTKTHVEKLLGRPVAPSDDGEVVAEKAPEKVEEPAVVAKAEDLTPTDDPVEATPTPSPSSDKPSSPPKTNVKRDPSQSRKLVKQGRSAYSRGQWDEASQLFHRALGYNSRNASAYAGLSDVYFDRGEFAQAVTYASKAVAIKGRSSTYRLKLGDAYLKLNRYPEARKQYEKAKSLGSKAAVGRLNKLTSMTGG